MVKTYNQPILKRDSDNNVIQESYIGDMTFRAEYSGTSIIYKGMSRPGSDEAAAVWQICKFAYDGSGNLTSIKWAEGSNNAASSEFIFIWANRAALIYS